MPDWTRSDFASPRPEYELLLGAISVDPIVAGWLIERSLSNELDWTVLTEVALAHRVVPALLAALESVDPSLVPSEYLAALRAHCGELRERSRVLSRELFGILDDLERESILAIPFKGPALGALLFDDAGLRGAGDLDILLRPGDVTRACELLEARGYVDSDQRPGTPLTDSQHAMYRRCQCEYRFVRDADHFVVEPHWALSQRPLALDVDYAGMLDRARPFLMDGRRVLTLAPEDLLLALAIHGAKHGWERLAWIQDVAVLLTRHPDLDLARCITGASERGCKRLLLVCLEVARLCGGARLPDPIQRLIDADTTAVRLASDVSSGILVPGGPSPRNDRPNIFRFQIRERWADRCRYVARTLLLPRREHIELVSLPGALDFMYYPMRLGHDYAVLPVWRLVKSLVRPG